MCLGLAATAGHGLAACGTDSATGAQPGSGGHDGGGGSAGIGGTTQITGGSGGGQSGAAGAGGGTSIDCQGKACTSSSIEFLTFEPCCAGVAKDRCGVEINAQIAQVAGVKPGCFALGEVGDEDPSCAGRVLETFGGKVLPGCCHAEKGACSFIADFSSSGGPNLGCLDPNNLPTEAGPAKACPAQDGAPPDAGGD